MACIAKKNVNLFCACTDGAACSVEASTTLVDTTHIISLGMAIMTMMTTMIMMMMIMMMMMMMLGGCSLTCHVPDQSGPMSLPTLSHRHSHTLRNPPHTPHTEKWESDEVEED